MASLLLSNLKRSWLRHIWLQVATLAVLIASYSVVLGFLTFGYNLKSVLTLWGESLQMTVYISESMAPDKVKKLEQSLLEIDGVEDIKFISSQQAAAKFKLDMSGFMPEMIGDQDFSPPFPASFVISFKDSLRKKIDSEKLGKLAKKISQFEGAEDVSYGQEWLNTYASLISGVNTIGIALIVVLLTGTIFVIGNSVKTAIFVRRDEIEILELFGASKGYIRLPYIIDGALLGFMASVFSILTIASVTGYLRDSISVQSVFLILKTQLHLLPTGWSLLLVFLGTLFGAGSSYFFVCRINDGWSASKRNNF